MTRTTATSRYRSIIVAVVVLLVIALFAWWLGNRPSSQPDISDAPTEQPAQTAEAEVPSNDTNADTSVENTRPSSPSTSFIPQDGLASIPTDRFFTTDKMNGLTPGKPQTTFESGDPVYIYAGINAPQAERIQLRWFGPDGKHILPSIYKNVSANTGVTGYRIYTYRIFREVGPYQVVLYNSAGSEIGVSRFVVEE